MKLPASSNMENQALSLGCCVGQVVQAQVCSMGIDGGFAHPIAFVCVVIEDILFVVLDTLLA